MNSFVPTFQCVSALVQWHKQVQQMYYTSNPIIQSHGVPRITLVLKEAISQKP